MRRLTKGTVLGLCMATHLCLLGSTGCRNGRSHDGSNDVPTGTISDPATSSSPYLSTLPFSVLASGALHSGLPDDFVFTDPVDWEQFWISFVDTIYPEPPLPIVDFSQEFVVGLVRFGATTSSYLEVLDVFVDWPTAEIVVEYDLVWPCGFTAVTYPYQFIALPIVPGEVVTEETLVQPPCL